MIESLGMICNAHFVGEACPSDSVRFTLTAGVIAPGAVGYMDGVAGSISAQPFSATINVMQIFADENQLGFITVRFMGDASSYMNGSKLKVDGVLYDMYDETNYDAGNDVSDIAYTIPVGASLFSDGSTHGVEFILAA